MNQRDTAAALQAPTQTTSSQMDDTTEESDLEEPTMINPDEITVAIFCALSCESVAVKYTLDKQFQCRPESSPQKYIYSFGQIGEHKVVIARPNQMGKVNAAHLAATISQQLPSVRFALMIGIGAGIPGKRDIRLGDIAVSIPGDDHPGVLEYDFGKTKKDGFTLKGSLNKPPSILLSADGQLEDDERMNKRPFRKVLKKIIGNPGYGRPNSADVLFDSTFHHVNEGDDCSGCEASSQKKIVSRIPRSQEPNEPVVHRGLILSGSLVVKNPKDRDLLRRGRNDAICYEMEAAGIMDEIPCLVIRGISDYADTHKQDAWHYYAAAVAAAYGKAILCKIDSQELERTKTIRETMTQINTKVDTINKVLQGVTLSQQEAKYTEILEWVHPGAASSRHSAVVSVRQAGTGKWFLLQTAFSEWLKSAENSSMILWCRGIPGAGKSTISSIVIDYLEKIRAQDTTMQTAVAYFYFDFSNKEIDTRKFTRCLLKQLTFQSLKIPQELVELFKTYSGSGKTEIEDQKIEDLLIQSASSFTTTYIVVDALDECAPDQRLRVLEILQKLADANARIFATSRPHPEDINEIFKSVDKIELGAHTNDIRKYIEAEIRRHQTRTPKARHISDELRDRIIDGLIQRSNGMFLLPKLQLNFLLRQATHSRMEAALKQILKISTPKGFHPIDETFNLMLGSIDECNRDITDKALSWLVVTKSPLQIQDLLVALAIEPEVFEITERQQLSQSTVLDICAGFIVVDESSGIVKLAHETVQEYLLRKPIDTVDALTSLTKSCLNYLRFEQFTNPGFWGSLGQTQDIQLEKIKRIPFYLYTVRNWEAQIIQCNQAAIKEDLLAFLDHRSSVLSYCQARKLTLVIEQIDPRYYFYDVGTDESPLHIAARIGHLGAVDHYISKGIDVHTMHNGSGQPIWEAVASGHIEVIKLLVKNGSSIQTAWREGRQPIHFAAAKGYYAIVKFCLEVYPEMVNITHDDGSSPLRESTVFGHEEVARLLLDAGADWRLVSCGKTIGFLALEQGWTKIFSLFLKKGLSLEQPLCRGKRHSGTPLHIAAGYGYEETVKEILDLGANRCVSLTDLKGNTALHNAVVAGFLPIVRLLVENGANINKKDGDGKTALELATESQFISIKNYLREALGVSSQDHQEHDKSLNAMVPQNSNTTSESHPTVDGISLSDIATVYNILTRKLKVPSLAAKKILDYAAYWVEQHVKRSGTVMVNEQSTPTPYIHINIDGPFIRKIKFRTVSHDQGWSSYRDHHGTYRECHSWIEVGIIPRNLKIAGVHQRTTLQTLRLQYNVHARQQSTEHTNEWDITTNDDPELVDFLSKLSIGDRISVYPKARFLGWRCYIDEAEMWVYSSIWEHQHSKSPQPGRISESLEITPALVPTRPTPENETQPTPKNKIQPTPKNKTQPTSENEVQPTPKNEIKPASENKIQSASENKIQSASENKIQPTPKVSELPSNRNNNSGESNQGTKEENEEERKKKKWLRRKLKHFWCN